MSLATILVVDDERNIRRALRMVLEGAGYDVLDAETGEQALEIFAAQHVDLVILDVRMPGIGGLATLERLRAMEDADALPVLMVSGHASVTDAVNACQAGVTDFFEKPLNRDRVLVSVRNCLKAGTMARELRGYRTRADEMLGKSQALERVRSAILKVAPTTGRVLITGESGTGKELVARAIHRQSPRASAPFIKVNCAAIPADLIESELFGHERGAFTGARQRRKGVFEMANRGTLFLDEIGDMGLGAQAKVLRALQSGEILRVGGESLLAVDVRIVAATNRKLLSAVEQGQFREDLYFRLNVVPIEMPPLHERREDIPILATHFFADFFRANQLRPKPLEAGILEALRGRDWPGNIRELKNVVERMAILSGPSITIDDLPSEQTSGVESPASQPTLTEPPIMTEQGEPLTLREYREQAERLYILEKLRACSWNVSKAAFKLGVERTNLHKKIKHYGLTRES
jgi:DNA-binding NtrC family response regulator